jgi:ubiquinone/menaquinone biosynthesis C-methylase UbiE
MQAPSPAAAIRFSPQPCCACRPVVDSTGFSRVAFLGDLILSHCDAPKKGEQVKDVAIREHFDTNTNLYVDKYEASYKVICHERIRLLKDYVDARPGQSLTILDVGCGAGIFADLLLDAYPHVNIFCLDSSQGMLKRNASDGRKILVLGDAKALPFRPQSFDLINVDTVMHHLVDRNGYRDTRVVIKLFLRSLHPLLKPGGLVIVREIYHESILWDNLGSRLVYELSTLRLPAGMANLLKRLGLKTANVGVCFLTRKQWDQVLRQTGFKVLSLIQKPWTSHPLRIIGFRHNGDLYYALSENELLDTGRAVENVIGTAAE